MKPLSTLLVTTILSGSIGIIPAFAETPTTPTPVGTSQQASLMTNADKQQYKEMLQEASTMMGHVAIANIALLHNMTAEATNNVQEALVIARKLEGQTTQLNADIFKLGKLKYSAVSGESHDYWLPIENDSFVVSDINDEYLKSKQPSAAEEDAQTVTTKVTLNTKQVRVSLENAAAAISAKNYSDAQTALTNAQESTFTEQTASELPLVTAHDNLVLAKALAASKDYNGASFALTHAKDALTAYQQTATKGQSTQVDKLQTEISALQTDISKEKPSMMAKIEKHIDTWIHEVESLRV